MGQANQSTNQIKIIWGLFMIKPPPTAIWQKVSL